MKAIKEKLNKKISLYYAVIAVIITVIIFSAYTGGSVKHSYEDGYLAGTEEAAAGVDIDSPSYTKGYEVGKQEGIQEGKDQGYADGLAEAQVQANAGASGESSASVDPPEINNNSDSTYTAAAAVDSQGQSSSASGATAASGSYCITKSGSKYHYTSCSTVQRGIEEGSVTYFDEVSQIPSEYDPCQRCAPPYR